MTQPDAWGYGKGNDNVVPGFIHNCLPNFRCKMSPCKALFGRLLEFGSIYLFGTHAIVHTPPPQQSLKLGECRQEAYLLHPLLAGPGWLFWVPGLCHFFCSASATFPNYQAGQATPWFEKGCLQHIFNNLKLGLVDTDSICCHKDEAANSIPHLTYPTLQKLFPEASEWKEACLLELQQMEAWGVWQVIHCLPHHKVIGNQWVFTQKTNPEGILVKNKARFCARGDL
ncbi:hypothetical protein O181_006182 [Austropuccinia psidii MF-1]|uniref:Reverse transcriptase Ty1/copia-type domain-containing protein n=1 Tax=Austropuccinia psidii MF-1 TaxID=1389203 RepID=A0A9Q3GHD3_9BASI|nr:hypothetical protein [Austropuccinia psidii MF-1]